MDVFVVVLIVVACVSFIVLIGKGNEKSNTESDSVEDSPSEVTPTPSTPGDEKTGPSCFAVGCWILVVALICFGVFMAVGIYQLGESLDSLFGPIKDFTDAVDHRIYGPQ